MMGTVHIEGGKQTRRREGQKKLCDCEPCKSFREKNRLAMREKRKRKREKLKAMEPANPMNAQERARYYRMNNQMSANWNTCRAFCLACGSDCCLHLQRSRKFTLNPTEINLIRVLADPKCEGGAKHLAHAVGMTEGTVKVRLSGIYHKLGWYFGNQRQLALWAIAYRDELGIPLPEKCSFPAIRADEWTPKGIDRKRRSEGAAK